MNPLTWGWFRGFKNIAFWGWVAEVAKVIRLQAEIIRLKSGITRTVALKSRLKTEIF